MFAINWLLTRISYRQPGFDNTAIPGGDKAAAPFSSAGVERVFSAAGKMHDDLRKSEKDSTLEHSLFAAFNAD